MNSAVIEVEYAHRAARTAVYRVAREIPLRTGHPHIRRSLHASALALSHMEKFVISINITYHGKCRVSSSGTLSCTTQS